MSVPSPATADPSSPREPFEVALLDAARTLAAARLQGFLEAHAPTGTLVAALTSVFPGIDAVSAARHLRALAAGTDWPAIRLVSAQDLPDGLAAYHAQTGTVLVSDRAFVLDAMEPGLVADLLLQELGHHLDALWADADTPGDEGAAFRDLVTGAGGHAPVATGAETGVAWIDGVPTVVELASAGESGGYEGSQRQVALEGKLDNEISFSFDFYGIPDRFIIRYDGNTIVDTGFVSYDRTDTVTIKRGTADTFEVIVATADEGTAWEYTVTSREAGLPDTSPLLVTAVDGKFEDPDEDGTFTLSGGTVTVGRKDGTATLLRIVGGTVELSEDELKVSGADVYAATGGATDLMFRGGFTMPYEDAATSALDATDIYRIGGLDTGLDGFVIRPGQVRFDTSFVMPLQVTGMAIDGEALRTDVLVLGAQGLAFGGPSGSLVLPIGGEYNLLDLFKVETTNHRISYDSPKDLIKYQGKFSIEAPIRGVDTKVEVDLAGENFVQIQDGKPDLKGSLSLETELKLRVVTFKGFELEIDTTGDPDTIKGTGSIEFPWRTTTPELDLSLGFVLDPLAINLIGFQVDDLNLMMGRPDVYLQKVKLEVENVAPTAKDPVTVTGGVGFTYGPQITIGDDEGDSIFDIGKVYIARADLEAAINEDSLAGEGTLALISDSIIKITGGITLDWKEGFLQGDGEIVYLEGLGGGIASGQGQVKIDSSFNFSSYGAANVRLPEVSLLGPMQGVSLGSGTAMVNFTNNGIYGDDFIAAWGILPAGLPVIGGRVIGLRAEFDGTLERIGTANLPPVPEAKSSVTATGAADIGVPDTGSEVAGTSVTLAEAAPPTEFLITGDQPSFVMFLSWDGDPLLDPQLRVRRPDGSTVQEADFEANGMAVIAELGSAGTVAVAVGPGTGASFVTRGAWSLTADNAAALGTLSSEAMLMVIPDDVIQVEGVNAVDAGVEIAYSATSDDAAARTMLFYDTDGVGFDGTPIVSDLGLGTGETFVWDPKAVAPGDYYVYAAVMSQHGVPVFDYYETPVTVARGVDLAVTTSLKDVRVDAADSGWYLRVTYDIEVENRGTRAASGVVVAEAFDLRGSDDDAIYGYYSINDGSYNSTDLYRKEGFSLDYGDVAAGATERVSVTLELPYWVEVPVGGLEVNHRTTVTSAAFDTDIGNNADDGRVTFYDSRIEPPAVVPVADLSVTLVSTEGGAFVGDDARYTLRVANDGPDAAPSVRLSEYLSGLTSYDITVDGSQVVWDASSSRQSIALGDLAAGASVEVVVSGRVSSAGPRMSSSEVVSGVALDLDPSDNLLTHTRDASVVAVSAADVSLGGSASTVTPAVGDTVTFDLTVTNSGPNVASSLVVKLDHSAGLVLLSGSGVQGSFDAATGLWTVGNLNPDISRTFTITARVDDLAGLFASAEVVAMGESDPDSTPDNGGGTEDDDVSLLSARPILTATSPVDNAVAVAVDADVVLTFSEDVEAVAGRFVSIRRAADDGVVASIEATDAQVGIVGNVVTVNPSVTLAHDTAYYVLLDAGAFVDASGDGNPGIASSTALGFVTEAAIVPIDGTDADDVLISLASNDRIDGAGGVDTAVYDGPVGQYRLEIDRPARTVTVTDRQAGRDGQDAVHDVELLRFGTQTFELFNPPRTEVPQYAQSRAFLFDAAYYLLSNPDLVPALNLQNAFDHYLAWGATEGRDPNAWFDPDYYQHRWPDLEAGQFDDAILFLHYNLYGVWEGRSAGPGFDRYDGNRYLADNPDVAAYVDGHLGDFLGSRTNGAIAHYVIYGAGEGRLAYDTTGAPIDAAILIGA